MTPYSVFIDAFLEKTIDFNFLSLDDNFKTEMVIGYLNRACSEFDKVCKYDLSKRDNSTQTFEATIDPASDQDVINIISEGMIIQWLKPYFYRNENLENALNTKDYSLSSSVQNMSKAIKDIYNNSQKDFVNMMREYSYQHADLTQLNM